MVAYNFKRQFVRPILDGAKAHTIRADRKRHARPGEQVQLYWGLRSKHATLIARATCASALPIRLNFNMDAVVIEGRPHIVRPKALDLFARSDGFDDWAGLRKFWHQEHDAPSSWSGVIVSWRGMFDQGVFNGW